MAPRNTVKYGKIKRFIKIELMIVLVSHGRELGWGKGGTVGDLF
jgi:hypothetical protein